MPPPSSSVTRRCAPCSAAPFTRRRYVVLCLALAALEGAERQITLGTLAQDIVRLSRADEALAKAGMRFELETRSERRDLVQVTRFLLELGVMVRIHGDEQRFIDHYQGAGDLADRRNDALYTLQRPVLAALLAGHARRHPGERLGRAALEQHVAAVVREHAHHWAKRVKEPGAEVPLLTQTLDRLEALGLVRCFEDGGVEPRPAIGRFALEAPDGPHEPRQGELP